MNDIILTGASRGIGRALALSLRAHGRLVLLSRDVSALEVLVREIELKGGAAVVLPVDLGAITETRAAGEKLVGLVSNGATLIHNAGLWPTKRQLTSEGFERSFVINCIAPLLLQSPLVKAGLLARVMQVSAGLLIKGRFNPKETPTGLDFSALRTYCSTKLCGAIAMRDFAAQHPELDVLVLHPGVVRTELGALGGPVGWLLSLVKRAWETPETCAARLTRIFSKERWSTPGQAAWMVEEKAQPWPSITEDLSTQAALREALSPFLRELAPR